MEELSMWKKRIICLVLVLCAALVMTACKQKETFPTTPQQPAELTTEEPQSEQNIFGDTPLPPQDIDFDFIRYSLSEDSIRVGKY